jgi:uncharacterized protein DUF397
MDLRWRKSSQSASSDNDPECVEVALSAGQVVVRDSKNAAGPWLRLPDTAWSAFMSTEAH